MKENLRAVCFGSRRPYIYQVDGVPMKNEPASYETGRLAGNAEPKRRVLMWGRVGMHGRNHSDLHPCQAETQVKMWRDRASIC